MGMLDDLLGGAIGKAVPQGNISKPLMLALLALLASGALNRQTSSSSGGADQSASAPSGNPLGDLLGGLLGGGPPATNPAASGTLAGGLLGGLGTILGQFQQAGQREAVDSWIGSGENRQVSPGQLGSALSPAVIRELSEQSGLSQQDVLAQLSDGLPDLVDRLTPRGRMPSDESELPLAELSRLSEQLR